MIGLCGGPVQWVSYFFRFVNSTNRYLNPLNAKLNLICHLLALLGAHLILHISRIRVNWWLHFWNTSYHILLYVTKCIDKMERDRLVLFVNKLILHRRNVKDIMDAGGVRILVDLLTLAHLHTSRYAGFRVTTVAVHLYRIMFWQYLNTWNITKL
jgi:hypothetical protein